MSEEVIKVEVDETPELSSAEKEESVLNKAGFDTKENVYKVDLRKQPEVKQDELQEQVEEKNEQQQEDKVEQEPQEEVNQTLTEVTDEKDTVNETRVAASDDDANATQEQEKIQPQEQAQVELPENVEKLVDFLKDNPGATLDDYARLNADYSSVNERVLLDEYYKRTKSHLDKSEIDFLIEDNFAYDENLDDEKDVKRKKLAYKEEIAKAKTFLEETKDKYYSEIKLKSGLNSEQQKAIDFFDRYKQEQSQAQSLQEKQSNHFTKVTDSFFNENFKGFDFKVGEKKYRYNVKDANNVKQVQSDVMNVLGSYLDENNMLKDGPGYHKALFAAKNADAIANHFYEQGKADAIKQRNIESKNINMGQRNTSAGVVEAGGQKVRVVSGSDSSKLKVKFRK